MFKKIIKKKLKVITILVIRKYRPRIIAVTGSVGKTSTKEAVYHSIKDKFRVVKSGGNLNTEIGAPLVFLGCFTAPANKKEWIKIILRGTGLLLFRKQNYPEVVVVELGADKPGDIRYLTGFIKPEIAIVTAVGETPVHVEFYQNSEQVAREKGELLRNIQKGGFAVINNDDPHLKTLTSMVPENVALLTFGKKEGSTIGIADFKITESKSMLLDFYFEKRKYSVVLKNTVATSLPYTIAAVAAAYIALGGLFEDYLNQIKDIALPPGRMTLIEGVKNSLIIDGSYNASPLSTASALDSLAQVPGKRKIAVIGEMLELGDFSTKEHSKIGGLCARKCDLLIAVGKMSPLVVSSAVDNGMDKEHCFSFQKSEDAINKVKDIIESGDVLLVKGSQGVRLEKIVYAVMEKKSSAVNILVRQSDYWKKK